MNYTDWVYPTFELKDLHKKTGQLLYSDTTDSDTQEGFKGQQLFFRDEKNDLYLIWESNQEEKREIVSLKKQNEIMKKALGCIRLDSDNFVRKFEKIFNGHPIIGFASDISMQVDKALAEIEGEK